MSEKSKCCNSDVEPKASFIDGTASVFSVCLKCGNPCDIESKQMTLEKKHKELLEHFYNQGTTGELNRLKERSFRLMKLESKRQADKDAVLKEIKSLCSEKTGITHLVEVMRIIKVKIKAIEKIFK